MISDHLQIGQQVPPTRRLAIVKRKSERFTWYVLRIVSGREKTAIDILKRYGIATVMPMKTVFRRRNRHSRQKEKIQLPIVPGYVFAGFHGDPVWYRVMQIPLVAGVVTLNGEPARVSEGQVAQMAAMGGDSGVIPAPESERYMVSGREVVEGGQGEVIEGPFADVVVTVTKINGRTATVLAPLFGGSAEVEISLSQIVRVD